MFSHVRMKQAEQAAMSQVDNGGIWEPNYA